MKTNTCIPGAISSIDNHTMATRINKNIHTKHFIYQHKIASIVMYMTDSQQGFHLDIGFTEHFNTQLVTTLNYNAITNFHFTNY
jgi:hypothetical protein